MESQNLVILLAIIVMFFLLNLYQEEKAISQELERLRREKQTNQETEKPVEKVVNQPITYSQPTVAPPVQRDYQAIYNPLYPPVSRNPYFPDRFRQDFYYPTSGYSRPFRQVGYLSDPNNPRQVLPLMGRQLDSHKHQYYTVSHFNPSVKIPIGTQVNELHSDEKVNVPQYGDLTVQTYPNDITYNYQ